MKNALMLSGLFAGLSSLPAMAQEGLKTIGKPVDGGLNFQPAATSLMEGIHKLDWMILVIITVICIFVAALLLWAIVRFNKRANPTPAKFSHYTPIEIAWTVIPILVLVFIGSFSLPQLFAQQEIPEGDINIKVTGYQWYWGYEYSDHEFGFESFMLPKEDLAANGYAEDEYLLATDTAVVVPSGKTIVMNVTGADVIHSWTIPAFGVKQDAVPGRLAQLWFKVEEGKEGIYFGQCSELCGKDHAYMPITVKVVTQAEYDAWLEGAKEEFAGIPQAYQVASN
ncbi:MULTISPECIES: cytochrome c oxidase subunit II [unclassified Leisingera]|uniref:cytochrome c oxidase subunit II n=1 Tax=unclassified Leisingera TaxID=2614906 RepID=UPI000305BBB7|nr:MULTISPECIES: cytochrome c oxidase subunit II [unclassified Leisingera]KIC16023.1 cytochrome C oxidase subunit II [Leisingera sp. ANG-DT]KIC26162.1 cytochrome C oxidase subunit II [Leisingera sp. ANG-S3]KIC30780.1 cytochrome C oxidase subunit II [Leisingera sp. ANG-M6]KIC30857.1 cytochrome C oxidase subunit II [Leisingera sp. ANG-S5]KIC55032.1 cytochrome C oxidase subunit II [Leisingera sp. ANG-S]